jgi:hypothetical protein
MYDDDTLQALQALDQQSAEKRKWAYSLDSAIAVYYERA